MRVGHSVRRADRIEYQRAVVRIGPSGTLKRPKRPAHRHPDLLASYLGANALLIVPPDGEDLPAGTALEAILTGPLADSDRD